MREVSKILSKRVGAARSKSLLQTHEVKRFVETARTAQVHPVAVAGDILRRSGEGKATRSPRGARTNRTSRPGFV